MRRADPTLFPKDYRAVNMPPGAEEHPMPGPAYGSAVVCLMFVACTGVQIWHMAVSDLHGLTGGLWVALLLFNMCVTGSAWRDIWKPRRVTRETAWAVYDDAWEEEDR